MSTTSIPVTTAKSPRWRKIAFYTPVVLFVALLVVFTGILIPALPYILTGWGTAADSFIHHVHEFLTSIFFWSLLVGVGSQLHRPERKAAPLLQAMAGVVTLIVVSLLSRSFAPPFAIFLVLILLAVGFHPVGIKGLWQREGGLHIPLLLLAGAAAIPAVLYAADHIGLQAMQMPGDEHAEFFHWGASATIALTTVWFTVIAALRLSGWKISAWSAAAVAVVLGVTGILFPGQASSIGQLWGAVALVWGLGVLGATHLLKPSIN